MKKALFPLILTVILLFSACSKEDKFGLLEFTKRMNRDFNESLEASDFILATDPKGEKYLIYERGDCLLSLSVDNNDTVKGISLTVTEGGEIEKGLDTYKKMCCVLTGSDNESQGAVLTNCGISADKIKFADSNCVNTVGKYKYTAICNDLGVTLFCDRL